MPAVRRVAGCESAMSTLSAFWRKQQTRRHRRHIDRSHRLRRHLAYYVVNHGFEIGDYSAGTPSISMWNEGARLRVGKYCSIADGVQFLLGGNHRTTHVTTFPLGQLTDDPAPEDRAYSRGDIVIGSDVWIGANAMILSGVTIGDGAVVGAGTVVLDDIPPYVIVQGSPARPYGKRFSDAIIRQLLELRWWDIGHEQVMAMRSQLQNGDVQAAIGAVSRIRGVPVLEEVPSGEADLSPRPIAVSSLEVTQPEPLTEPAIVSWCVKYLAELVEVPAEQVDKNVTFAGLGMDSVTRATFMFTLEEFLNVTVTPDDIAEYPTIAALAHHLAPRVRETA
jgi:acetyltransferase-like isoleucine patch superfamily enzyme/acyl carrier protein